MRPARAVLAVSCLLLVGCSAESSDGKSGVSSGGSTPATSSTMPAAPSELGTIKESGYGQRGEYVWVAAVVHNNSTYVGQTVTVVFNLLDDKGNLIATESQVESFSRPQGDHIIGTQSDVEPGQRVARIEATLSVKAEGTFSDEPFPEVPVTNYRLSDNSTTATFEVANPMAQAIEDPRIGVLCRDAGGKIIGGGSTYPELIPANGRILAEASVLVSAPPARCEALVGAPVDWDASASSTSSSDRETTAAAPSGTAEAAFKIWVDQFRAKNWDDQYATLLSAQQKLISKKQYRACRSEKTPAVSWIKALSVQDAGRMNVPGTKLLLPATKVVAQLRVDGVAAPVDAHMFLEGGRWKWTMTQENLDGCLG